MYDELVKRLWECASGECFNCSQYTPTTNASVCQKELMKQAADAIEELSKPKWIPVTERLPKCEKGTEVGNIEWINCGMVFAGCFGRGGKYRDAYFRTWTDATEGIDAKDADYWRPCQIPEPPKEGET